MRGSENICFVGVHIFKVAVRFPWSASISRRYLCSVTIGALASGILLFSERPGVWRKCNVKFFCEVRSSAGQWKKKPTDRQKRPDPRTQALKTNENKINSRIILSLFIRLRWSELATRSLLSVVWLFLSLTGGTPHYVRQTPPVGRSEKVRRHSPELQWSPIPITSD